MEALALALALAAAPAWAAAPAAQLPDPFPAISAASYLVMVDGRERWGRAPDVARTRHLFATWVERT